MSYTIEPREGLEVYATENGRVCIKQEHHHEGDAFVFVHPDDVPTLIAHLTQAAIDARDAMKELESNTTGDAS